MTERLPLFPLNTVLVPGQTLPLHIFEPRYRTMLDHVLAGTHHFGVLLIREGQGESDPTAVPHEIGTVAEVTDVVRLDDGRLNISTTGRRRFRVVAFHYDRPYLSGDVEYLDDAYCPSEKLEEAQAEVVRLSIDYVTASLGLTPEQAAHIRLPADPVALSYKVAALFLEVHLDEVQDLLAASTVEERLTAEALMLQREVTILQQIGTLGDRQGRRSPN